MMLPFAIRHGRYSTNWGIRPIQAKEIEIHTLSPHIIDTDGELTTQTPAQFRIVPQAISVFVPVKLGNDNISVKPTK